MLVDLELFKRRIEDAYDLDYVCDVLGIDVAMILDRFEDVLLIRWHEFEELDNMEEED